jgi:hypothetical protein
MTKSLVQISGPPQRLFVFPGNVIPLTAGHPESAGGCTVPFEVKSFSNKYINLLLIMAFLAVQGCALAAPAAVTYGVEKLTTSKSEPAKPASQSTALRTYPEYVTAMERINTEREKAGLPRRPIMTQEEWVCAQKAGSTAAPAPATKPSTAPAETAAPAPTTTAAAPAPSTTSTTTAAPAVSPAPAPVPATSPAETPEKASEAK